LRVLLKEGGSERTEKPRIRVFPRLIFVMGIQSSEPVKRIAKYLVLYYVTMSRAIKRIEHQQSSMCDGMICPPLYRDGTKVNGIMNIDGEET